jgi:hypothetical protein
MPLRVCFSVPEYRNVDMRLHHVRQVFSAAILGAAISLVTISGCTKESTAPEGMPKIDRPDLPRIPIASRGKCNLSGKITHGDEPIDAGRLFFYSGGAMVPVAGVIRQGGRFEAHNLPSGDLQVCVLLDPKGGLPFPNELRHPNDPVAKASAHGAHGKKDPRDKYNAKMPKDKGGPGTDKDWQAMASVRAGVADDLPPSIVAKLKDYTIPSGKEELYKELHKKYSKRLDNPLHTTVQDGDNVYDIVLP